MDLAPIVQELTALGLCSRAFSLGELLGFMHAPVEHEVLRSSITHDSRFAALQLAAPDEERFILDCSLFRWLSNLNIRLRRAGQYKLNERQLALAMSHLLLDGRWDMPPAGAIRWGRSLGLVSRCCRGGHYVFPLARILSMLSEPSLRLAIQILHDLHREQAWRTLSTAVVEQHVEEGLSQFNERVVDIVQKRTGLSTGAEMTLEEAGSVYGFTRERARQLECKFWDSLKRGSPIDKRRRRLFLAAFLCDFMDESGTLVVKHSSPKRSLRSFLARCAGLPQATLSEIGVVVIAASPEDLGPLESREWFPDEVEGGAIACRVESDSRLALVDSHVRVLAKGMARLRRRSLKGPQRVYLALRAIGKPAHYSEITRIHNELFPDRPATEHSIGVLLGFGKHGVVWVGVRGKYALREWGYERPSATLFDRVREIVEKVHEATGRPVPFAVIAAEIGKYRRIVNPHSVTIAAHCDPGLVRVDKNCFIPRGPDDKDQDEISSEELDRILEDFAQDGG